MKFFFKFFVESNVLFYLVSLISTTFDFFKLAVVEDIQLLGVLAKLVKQGQ